MCNVYPKWLILRIDLKSFFPAIVREHEQKHLNNQHKWDSPNKSINNTSGTLFTNPSMYVRTSIKHTHTGTHRHTHTHTQTPPLIQENALDTHEDVG